MGEKMKNSIVKNNANSRYRSLIIFITLFVVIIVGVLGLNIYLSIQLSSDAQEINLAGRQRMLSQRTSKAIQKLIQSQNENQDIQASFDELKQASSLFGTTLNAFMNGGSAIGTEGKSVDINRLDDVNMRETLSLADTIWNGYRQRLDKVIDSGIDKMKLIGETIEYVSKNNDQLLKDMNDLTSALEQKQYSGAYVNLAGQQRMLSQRIAKKLFELINAQSKDSDIEPLVADLSNDQRTFNQTLDLLSSNSSASTEIKAVEDPEIIALIEKGRATWQPLDGYIDALVNSDNSQIKELAAVNSYAQKENVKLLGLMNDLTTALEVASNQRSTILRYIQLFGILLAVGMFSVIIFFFVKQLRKADTELVQAKNETDRILETVNDGLFLMDRKHTIGSQYSDSLVEVINVDEPAGKSFLSILRKIVPEKTLQTAKDYMELLYGDRVNEDLVTDLNPLDKVEVYFGGEDLNRDVGHLGFQFKRVIENENVTHLLVQVEDITEKVKLEKELAESEEKAKAQFDLMLEVLHVNPEMLGQFLTESEESLKEVNNILQERTRTETGNREKLTAIFRFIHRIKGDAAGLELQGFEQKAHEFEDLIAALNEQKKLTGKDFLPLAISLDAFMGQIDSLRSLISKLSELQSSVTQGGLPAKNDPDWESNSNLTSTLKTLSKSVAHKQNKKVMLNLFNEHLLPDEYSKEVQDILTQLIRNSIAHGIESPEHRTNQNKTTEGLINVKFYHDYEQESFIVEYSDDGQGLIEQNILDSAIKKGLISEEVSKKLNRNQIMSLIFKPGFSTVEESNMDAGRGVGMDVVSDLVKKMGGKMGIKSIENKLFKMVIKFPQVKNTVAIAEVS